MTTFSSQTSTHDNSILSGAEVGEWQWSAVRDRWSLGHALAVLGVISLTVWLTVLLALLS